MDLHLTPDQQLLVSTARDFLRRQCPPAVMAESVASERGFSEELWKEISVLGWPGLLVPAEYGGSGGSMIDVALLLEEMGRACFPSPYTQSAVALAEESASIDDKSITLPGEPGGRVTGRKLFVNDAHVADELIVATRGGSGLNLFLLEARRPGITVLPMEAMAGDRPCEVSFADVVLRGEDTLGAPGRGWEMLRPALQAGALARAAEMVGCAQRILDIAVEHAKGRKQFGRPLGSFQAIQHACADLLRDVETARGLAYRAASWIDAGRDASAEVAMAKAYAGRTAQAVARKGHQLLGAISFCEEHSLHLFHKRIVAAALDFGDPSHHLETVASAMGLA